MKGFFIAASVILSLLICADEMTNIPKLKIILSQEKIEIVPTGSVTQLDNSNIKISPDSASSKLAIPGKEFLWKPSELTARTTGGADIYSHFLTSDGSAAVICERVGGMDNPNGLRIVAVDTASGKIIRVSKVFEYDILHSKLINDTTLLAAAFQSGKKDQGTYLICIDIVNEEIRTSELLPAIPEAMAAAMEKIYLLSGTPKCVRVYDTDTFSLQAECQIKNQSAAGLEISEDGNILAVFGGKQIELYDGKTHNGTLYSHCLHKVNNGNLTRCAMLDKSGSRIVFFAPEKQAHLFMNGRVLTLPGIICGEVWAADEKTGTFVLENRMRELEVFEFPGLDSKAKYTPRKMRPISRNDNTALFFLPTKTSVRNLILADHRGNLWKLEFKGKRGKKIPVLLSDTTGIRQR